MAYISIDISISDTKYPSLSLWFYFQEYLTTVLSLLYPFSSIEEKEHLFDLLKLDKFAIDAKDESQKTLENVDKYIRTVSTLIKI